MGFPYLQGRTDYNWAESLNGPAVAALSMQGAALSDQRTAERGNERSTSSVAQRGRGRGRGRAMLVESWRYADSDCGGG